MSAVTTDEVIGDVLRGIDIVRPGVPLLAAFNPAAAAIVAPALTLLYEGLVSLRHELTHETDETRLIELRTNVTRTIQELAAAKFGALPRAGFERPGFEGIDEEKTGR